jgi:hypothetical protein
MTRPRNSESDHSVNDAPTATETEVVDGPQLNDAHVGRRLVRKTKDGHDQFGTIIFVYPDKYMSIAVIDWSRAPGVSGTREYSAFPVFGGGRTIELLIDAP